MYFLTGLQSDILKRTMMPSGGTILKFILFPEVRPFTKMYNILGLIIGTFKNNIKQVLHY